ncbi:MAG: choice-of-anchor B family protein [Flavobacteriales bacterium]|nr:choice-of-anchor B family protein [Flavobacteriales bacterium]MBK7943753.1 choice-of-anchor B family protein [Flavobacteriales bacterium]MBK9699566.1 choice-of-anchor B family protein [Flavobacteriales bacterium]
MLNALKAHGRQLTASGLFLVLLPLVRAQDSLNVTQVYRWYDAGIPGTTAYDNAYNAVWGYARDGREYAIIGSTMGTHIIDVTPGDIQGLLHFIPGNDDGPAIIHREYKTYRDRLYAVTDEGQGTLQIIDLRDLPGAAPVLYNDNDLFSRAHTLWIDTANARLYTHYGNTDFAIWSLADPDAPTLLLKPEFSVPWWNSVGGVHDAYTVDNICYTNDVDGMHIIDFTDVGNPQLLGSLNSTEYPQPGYNHSGWLHDNGWLYVMADETHGTDLKLFDVSDPTDIQFIDTIGPDRGPGSITHNPCFQGDLLHVAWYEDGYWLWNVSDPQNTQLLGWYDMHPEPYSFSYKGAWGVYPYLPSGQVLISEMQHGLFVLDISQAVGMAGERAAPGSGLIAFPNPSTESVVLRVPAALPGPWTVTCTDATGRAVEVHAERTSAHEVWVNTRNFAPGSYVVDLGNGTERHTTTLMIAHE